MNPDEIEQVVIQEHLNNLLARIHWWEPENVQETIKDMKTYDVLNPVEKELLDVIIILSKHYNSSRN